MSKTISGRDALQQIDRSIARLRKRLSDAVNDAETVERRKAEVRDDQIVAYRELADIRLQYLDDAEAEDLDRVHRQALKLLQSHDKRVADQRAIMQAAQAELERLEDSRLKANNRLEEAIETYESIVAQVESELSKDPSYQALVNAFDDVQAVAHRAGEKLAVARDERDEKGAPYEGDPLFMYLWERGFRTTEYSGRGLFKMLDAWVAKLCNYDDARANYKRLNDIPTWLEQHVSEQEAEVLDAKERLEAAEQTALDQGGAEDARHHIAAIRDELAQLDASIEIGETTYRSEVADHKALSTGDTGPIQEARSVLIEGMQRFAFEDLRELAAETVTRRDDNLVDELVALRTEQLEIEVLAEQRLSKPDQLQQDLSEFERMRRGFKAGQLDSHYARYKRHAFDEAIADLSRGLSDAEGVLSRLRRNVKRRKPKTSYGFGGSRRHKALGLPDVLGGIGREILREVEREITRSDGFGGYSGGSRRSRRTNFPSPRPQRRSSRSPRRKGRGGFKTGGGF
ncbi:MAG: hypothetical protein AAGH90_09990 [Pseudomonadota bacterium]